MGYERDDLVKTAEEGIGVDSLPKWLRDLFDYNNESAGRETGRAHRFTASDGPDSPEEEKKKEGRRFSELMRLLQDPEYARLYGDAVRAVDEAGEAAERALDKLSHDAREAQQAIEELRSGAAELPDGRKVFRGADGRVYCEDGSDVTAQRDEIRGLTSSTASWEEFKRARENAEDIERRRREVDEFIRGVVDPAKRRLGDPDHPLTPDELRRLQRINETAPADVRAQFTNANAPSASVEVKNASLPNSSAADQYAPTAPVAAPDLFAKFSAASNVVSDQFTPASPAPKV